MFYIGTLVNISSIIEDIRRCYEGQSYFYMKSINVCREHLWGDDWYEVGGNSSRCVDCRHFVINPTANDFKVSSLYLIILYYLCWILMAQHCQDLLVTQGMIQSQPITEVFFLMMHTAHTAHTAHTGAHAGYINISIETSELPSYFYMLDNSTHLNSHHNPTRNKDIAIIN